MATVRTVASAAKLINLKNAIWPNSLKLLPVYSKRTVTSSDVSVRWKSYSRDPRMHSREPQTEVEVVNDPIAWAIVEHLIATETIPTPKPKAEYPSGWKPPKLDKDLPYFVQRTPNHMHSVHMKFDRRTAKRFTVIRRIQGDIWALGNDLKYYLEKVEKKYVASCVNEAFGKIYFKGDHVNNIKVWLEKQGF